MSPPIKVRSEVNERLKQKWGCATDGEVARRIGVSPSTWSRALRGVCAPGPRLSSRLMQATGLGFNELFELPPTSERESA